MYDLAECYTHKGMLQDYSSEEDTDINAVYPSRCHWINSPMQSIGQVVRENVIWNKILLEG